MKDIANPELSEGAVRGNTASYIAGFLLSLLLTLSAYFLVVWHKDSQAPIFTHKFLIVSIVVLAVVQLFVQLLFFLHLDRESKPRWNLLVASFAAIVVLILVFGSLWIMDNLNYHMAPLPSDKNLIKDEGIRENQN